MIINSMGRRTLNDVQACWAMDSRARIKHINCRRKRIAKISHALTLDAKRGRRTTGRSRP